MTILRHDCVWNATNRIRERLGWVESDLEKVTARWKEEERKKERKGGKRRIR
jgi:hypothetical protein